MQMIDITSYHCLPLRIQNYKKLDTLKKKTVATNYLLSFLYYQVCFSHKAMADLQGKM